MIFRGEIQGFVYKGFPEVRACERETDVQPRAAQRVFVRVVDVKDEVERAALQTKTGDVDLLQHDIGRLELDRIPERGERDQKC